MQLNTHFCHLIFGLGEHMHAPGSVFSFWLLILLKMFPPVREYFLSWKKRACKLTAELLALQLNASQSCRLVQLLHLWSKHSQEWFFCIFLQKPFTSWRVDVFFFVICRPNACCLIGNPGEPSPCPESKVWYEKQLYNLNSENILLLHHLPLIRLEPTTTPTPFLTCLKSFSSNKRVTEG